MNVRKIKGVFRRCTKRKNPAKPPKKSICPDLAKYALFGKGVMMNLTITKISFMHGQCNDKFCPLCKGHKANDPRQNINEWVHSKLTVIKTGYPKSPWWEVEEPNGDCYRTLRGNLRLPGYYDKNPHVK